MRRSQSDNLAPARRAFTLIELITVIAILGVLLGVVLPSASKMWAQRNEAGSANMVRGLLLSARSQAIRKGEVGLFFYADAEGHQHIVFIEREPPQRAAGTQDYLDCQANGDPTGQCVSEILALNRFRVMDGKVYSVPPPYRVSATWALDDDPNSSSIWSGWPQQLQNSNFPFGTSGRDTPRYDRNYFTVIFNARGELVVGRNVFIHDPSNDDNEGDTTTLTVLDTDEAWYQVGTAAPAKDGILPSSFSASHPDTLFDMVALDDGRAANFKSVEGVVVYDESQMEGLLAVERQSTLGLTGQPLYVSRYTGDVIFGPRGE